MKVYIESKDKNVIVKASSLSEVKRRPGTPVPMPSVNALLKKLNINPVTVLVVKNGVLVTEDSKLSEKDNVKILAVVSGG